MTISAEITYIAQSLALVSEVCAPHVLHILVSTKHSLGLVLGTGIRREGFQLFDGRNKLFQGDDQLCVPD